MIVNSNREMLLVAVEQLGALKDELVFGRLHDPTIYY